MHRLNANTSTLRRSSLPPETTLTSGAMIDRMVEALGNFEVRWNNPRGEGFYGRVYPALYEGRPADPKALRRLFGPCGSGRRFRDSSSWLNHELDAMQEYGRQPVLPEPLLSLCKRP